MNFFARQDLAHRKTSMLVLYFSLAVLLIIGAINAVILGILYFNLPAPPAFETFMTSRSVEHAIWLTSTITFLAILGATLVKYLSLLGGGSAIAKMMGAKRVSLNTKDLQEKKFIHVVEEMSIASGTPMPTLYVLEDDSINAFVAGYKPTQTVCVVTRGALTTFDREELQAVIGHEFSHIFNGDMRINLRLMAILAGILFISQIGYFLMHTRSNNSRDSSQAVIFGLILYLIGYIGFFFASIIKLAIARQREYLADASSVQFTRNPMALAAALTKIRRHKAGSFLANAHAEDVSHFCFGPSIPGAFFNMLSTHPPLEKRIQAIDPNKEVITYLARKIKAQPPPQKAPEKPASPLAGLAGITAVGILAQTIGTPTPDHMAHAQGLLQALPMALRDTVHTQEGAKNIIYSYLLQESQMPESFLALLHGRDPKTDISAIQNITPQLNALGEKYRLPLVMLAIEPLRQIEDPKKTLETIDALIHQDETFTLFELILYMILENHIDPEADKKDSIRYPKIAPIIDDVAYLLRFMILISEEPSETQHALWETVIKTLPAKPTLPFNDFIPEMNTLKTAIQKMRVSSPMVKQLILTACTRCVFHDKKINLAEGELLRFVAECLDCPMPPILN